MRKKPGEFANSQKLCRQEKAPKEITPKEAFIGLSDIEKHHVKEAACLVLNRVIPQRLRHLLQQKRRRSEVVQANSLYTMEELADMIAQLVEVATALLTNTVRSLQATSPAMKQAKHSCDRDGEASSKYHNGQNVKDRETSWRQAASGRSVEDGPAARRLQFEADSGPGGQFVESRTRSIPWNIQAWG